MEFNQSYKQANATGTYKRYDIYESTRKHWKIRADRAKHIGYVLGVYKGIVRCVIKVKSHSFVTQSEEGTVYKKPRSLERTLLKLPSNVQKQVNPISPFADLDIVSSPVSPQASNHHYSIPECS